LNTALGRLDRFEFRIQNFKSFVDSEWISVRPITLFFGKNHSGKSVLTQALPVFLGKETADGIPDSEQVVGARFQLLRTFQTAYYDADTSFALSFKSSLTDERIQILWEYSEEGARVTRLGNDNGLFELSDRQSWRAAWLLILQQYTQIFHYLGHAYNCGPELQKVVLDAAGAELCPVRSITNGPDLSVALTPDFYRVLINPLREVLLAKMGRGDHNPSLFGATEIGDAQMPAASSGLWSLLRSDDYSQKELLYDVKASLRPADLCYLPASRTVAFNANFREFDAYLGRDVSRDATLSKRINDRLAHYGLNKVEIDQDAKPTDPLSIRTDVYYRPVDGQDFAVGLGQMGSAYRSLLPIFDILEHSDFTTLCIEEPELHLHPSAQVKLADDFVDLTKEGKKTFILETHSENILLRIMRRVQEGEIKASDVQIYYVEREEGQSRAISLGLLDNGNFTRRWPEGFFDQKEDWYYLS